MNFYSFLKHIFTIPKHYFYKKNNSACPFHPQLCPHRARSRALYLEHSFPHSSRGSTRKKMSYHYDHLVSTVTSLSLNKTFLVIKSFKISSSRELSFVQFSFNLYGQAFQRRF